MTQEEKQKLFIALCGYFPYGVKCNINGDLCKIERINIEHQQFYLKKDNEHGGTYSIVRGDVIKPYLRPMSSMTEDERFKYLDFLKVEIQDGGYVTENYVVRLEYIPELIDWLNAHHFDFRNLIERGLAIDCTDLNVY